MLPSWKSTYLILIPKTDRLALPADFRPINPYKVVANVLPNWMKPLLSDLISSTQGAFVGGRSNVVLLKIF